ncbi:MAG: glycosyltransferase family 39 protein, partial [Actinobacteria bacterium]|nr:glycosyltransferase family 39 protein [Actinomycetota bacterium]
MPGQVGNSAPGRRRQTRRLDIAALVVLVVVLAFLWGRAAGTWFWLDEGIATGVASHPLRDIPHLLRQDGAPPLYYVVLNLWMSLVGRSDAQTHLLSLSFALATVPAALWAGWSLFGRRAGWICALVVAINPFVAAYANETRMYSLVVLLTLLALAAFLHAFVYNRRGYLPVFAALLAALLYTHNWGVLVGAGTGLAAIGCIAASQFRRRLVVDTAMSFGAAFVIYAPWLPTLIYQRGQNLQPWAQRPTLVTMRADAIELFGAPEAFIVLALGVGIGLATLSRRALTPAVLATLCLGVVSVVIAAGGWMSGVWAYRYLAALLAPLVLLAGLGLSRGGKPALACLGAVAIVTAPIGVKTPPEQKSNAKAVALG